MGLEGLVVTRRRTLCHVSHCFVILSEGSDVETDFLSEFPPNIIRKLILQLWKCEKSV